MAQELQNLELKKKFHEKIRALRIDFHLRLVGTISIAWTIVIFFNYSYYSIQKNRNSPQNRQSQKFNESQV